MLILAGSGIHLLSFYRARDGADETRKALGVDEARLGNIVRRIEEINSGFNQRKARLTLRHLAGIDSSGIIHAVDPAKILTVIAGILPAEAKVISLRLKVSPPSPSISIEAKSSDSDAAREFLAALSGSSALGRAELLEERIQDDGQSIFRIEAELKTPVRKPHTEVEEQ